MLQFHVFNYKTTLLRGQADIRYVHIALSAAGREKTNFAAGTIHGGVVTATGKKGAGIGGGEGKGEGGGDHTGNIPHGGCDAGLGGLLALAALVFAAAPLVMVGKSR